jgi:DNA-directed RNA polymerase subunit RPC12/RpoP
VRAWSDEYAKFKLNGKCPNCGNRHLVNVFKALSSWKFFDGQDQPLSMLTPIWSIPPGSYMLCQKCGYRLVVFEADKVVRPSLELIDLAETYRSEERIGRDERLIDNSSSMAEVTRKFLVTREWSRDCKLEREVTDRTSEGLTIGDQQAAHLSFETERVLRQRYSINDRSREVYSEEVTIVVPPGSRLRVLIDWKNIWQHGTLKVRDSSKRVWQYQFRVVAGVTFDQSQAAA